MNISNSPSRTERFASAPIVLQAYTLFAIAITLVDFGSMFASPLRSAIVPYTGWMPSMIYMFTIYFSVAAAITNMRKLVYGIVGLLCVGLTVGCIDMVSHLNRPSALPAIQSNPYLAYAPHRPIVTIVIPSAWLLLLLSPVVRKWMQGTDDERPDTRQHQFALRDLLYLTMAVAVSLALSIALVGVVERSQQKLALQPQPRDAAS